MRVDVCLCAWVVLCCVVWGTVIGVGVNVTSWVIRKGSEHRWFWFERKGCFFLLRCGMGVRGVRVLDLGNLCVQFAQNIKIYAKFMHVMISPVMSQFQYVFGCDKCQYLWHNSHLSQSETGSNLSCSKCLGTSKGFVEYYLEIKLMNQLFEKKILNLNLEKYQI